jgi:predicted transcriptional regulator
MHPQMKDQLKHLADLEKCTVPDLIREAVKQYLTTKKATKLTSTPTNLTV